MKGSHREGNILLGRKEVQDANESLCGYCRFTSRKGTFLTSRGRGPLLCGLVSYSRRVCVSIVDSLDCLTDSLGVLRDGDAEDSILDAPSELVKIVVD